MRLPRAFFLYIFFATISFALLLSNIKITPHRYSSWRGFFLHLLSPAMWSVDSLLKTNLNLPKNIMETLNAKRENIVLKKKLIEYEGQISRFNDIINENKFLRDVLNIKKEARYHYITAEVILRDPNSWSYSCLINKGARDGIKESSAVVLVKNDKFVLAGKVKEVFDNTSEVMLLTNPLFAVPAQIPSSGCDGLVEPLSDRLLLFNHPSSRSAPVGSEVTVSPLSKIFPSGILIGRVVESYGAYPVSQYEKAVAAERKIIVQPEFLKIPMNFVVIIVKS